jgi:uncharacterized protein (DUF4415 family)
MKKTNGFNFKDARRITQSEVSDYRKAISKKLGQNRKSRGRPPKGKLKFVSISIRLNPVIIEWAKSQAKSRGVGYQTVINEELLKLAV